MLEVTTFGFDTKSSSFSGVPNHLSQSFFIYVLRKSFDAPSEITYVLGLLSPHKLRALVPEWIVQWWKIGRIWWQRCWVFREMIWSPNFDRKNSKHCAVTWQLAPSCWNQYSFLVATCFTVPIPCFSTLSPSKHLHLPMDQTIQLEDTDRQ